MRSSDKGWLAAELEAIRADFEKLPEGFKKSYKALYEDENNRSGEVEDSRSSEQKDQSLSVLNC